MAQTQKVSLPDGGVTWTVLDRDYAVVQPVEQWLEWLRVACACSPNTVQAYSRGLALWWHSLEETGANWRDPGLTALSGFIGWLTSGDLPTARRRPGKPAACGPRTVSLRLAALASFYEWSERQHGTVTPRLGRTRRDPAFQPFLAHLRDRRHDQPAALVPRRRWHTGPTPVFLPAQVQWILDAAATFDPTNRLWAGNLRDRLLLEILAETGLRLGEVLGVRHEDWVVGRGATPYIRVVPRDDNPNGARVKNMRGRRVFVSDRLERLYGEFLYEVGDLADRHGLPLRDTDPVVVNTGGGRLLSAMTPSGVYRVVERLQSRLGDSVPTGWTPHWFRHTHATALLLNGVPEHVVMRRLGHAQVQTTLDLYGWVTEEAELRSVAEWRSYAQGWRLPSMPDNPADQGER
jgi:site-specific recombinase XerD